VGPVFYWVLRGLVTLSSADQSLGYRVSRPSLVKEMRRRERHLRKVRGVTRNSRSWASLTSSFSVIQLSKVSEIIRLHSRPARSGASR
jgi:hypothetical protein